MNYRTVPIIATVPFAVLALSATAIAKPYTPSSVPASAGGVVHIDLAGLSKTQLWRELRPMIPAEAMLKKELREELPKEWRDKAKGLINMAFDTAAKARSFTAWVNSKDKGAIIVDAPGSQRLVGAMQLIVKAKSHRYRGATVFHTPGDQGFVASVGNLLIASDDKSAVHLTIDAWRGKAKSLGASGAIPLARARNGLVFVAGFGQKLLNTIRSSSQAKLLQAKLRSAEVQAGESNGSVFFLAKAKTDSAATASKLEATINGLRALMSFADDEPAIKKLLGALTVKTQGRQVAARVELPVSDIVRLIKDSK